jgi:hypothetical protein
LLVKNNADDWTGKPICRKPYGELAKHHIFPRGFIKEKIEFESNEIEKMKINCLGNITFIDKSENISIGDTDPKEYLKGYDPLVLEKHFIPVDESLWDINRYDEFLDRRVELIYEFSKKIFDFIR